MKDPLFVPWHDAAALEPEREELVVVLAALLQGRPEGQQDDLRVHHQEVQVGTAALEHHPNHVLLCTEGNSVLS